MALILWVLEAKRCLWLYEQPQTSLLWEHPRMQHFLKNLRGSLVYKTHMWMGSYGANTPKGTHLWGPTEAINKFALPLPQKEWEQQLVTKKTLDDGRIQVTGNSALKESQAYPKEFGRATVCIWKVAPKREMPSTTNKIPTVWKKGHVDTWSDANLTEVMQFLSLGTMK